LPPEGLVLGFDTSAALCAAALLSGGRVLAARHHEIGRGEAERVMTLLEAVLAEGGAGWRELAALGVGTGPGNFTGVRGAVAAARGLALGLGVPAVGVSGFEALAVAQPGAVLAAVATLHGQVAVARVMPGAELAGAPWVGLPEALPAAWRGSGLDVVGAAAAALAALTGGRALVPACPAPEAIARIAAARAAAGPVARPAPLYLRPPDAAPAPPPPAVVAAR